MKNILFAIFFSIAAVFVFGSCSSVEQEIPVLEKIVLDVDELTLQVGEEHTFKVTLVPNDAPAALSWTSSNPEVVSVKDGVVKALGAGTATIEVRSGEIYSVCEITVLDESEPDSDSESELEKILLDCEELNLNIGEQYTFKVTLMPEGVQADKLVWTSDNPTVVAVENGVVTALQAGDAVVKVTCGEISASCKVTVNEPQITLLTLNPESVEMYVGGTAYLTATVVPDNTGLELQWTSSDDGIVTVDNTGKLTAMSAGEAVVTVTCGNKSAECKVTVIEESAAPAVGYYYYSDGTWGATLLQEKQVVGVVFYVGNPAKDDAVLAKEHAGCIHGLVVSINEMSGFAWQSGYASYNSTVAAWMEKNLSGYQSVLTDINSEDGSRILGYNHTKAIEAFNAAPENSAWPVEAIQCLDDFRNSNQAPGNSSGWYLPSAKELSLLSAGVSDGPLSGIASTSNLELMNTVLGTIAGAAKIQGPMGLIPASYYTSSEVSAGEALMMTTYSGGIMSSSKSEPQKIRPVLAF